MNDFTSGVGEKKEEDPNLPAEDRMFRREKHSLFFIYLFFN